MSETATCIYCGETDLIDNMPVLHDGQDVCWSCADTHCSTCANCGLMFKNENLFEFDNDTFLCDACRGA